MNFAHKLARNVRTLLANPAIGLAYSRWLLGRRQGRVTVATHFGARLSEFENFSNYWGTIRKIPSAEQFNSIASFLNRDNAVCFDVGANIGSFAIILGKRSPDCCIHAFEPAPNTARILQLNIDHNHLANVKVHKLAVTDHDGTVGFSNDPSISQRNHILGEDEDRIASCEVATTSLDSFCRRHGIERIGFAKVDCEGVEPLVLRGGSELLREKRVSAILIEVCPRNLRAFGFSIRDLVTAAGDFGYSFYRFDEHGSVGEQVNCKRILEIESEDMLLLPR